MQCCCLSLMRVSTRSALTCASAAPASASSAALGLRSRGWLTSKIGMLSEVKWRMSKMRSGRARWCRSFSLTSWCCCWPPSSGEGGRAAGPPGTSRWEDTWMSTLSSAAQKASSFGLNITGSCLMTSNLLRSSTVCCFITAGPAWGGCGAGVGCTTAVFILLLLLLTTERSVDRRQGSRCCGGGWVTRRVSTGSRPDACD
mmetsp:Transcript_7820/g.19229  ORF Transcript_7820/g.19229 Transcript_7820/m.19229 type:complete len:200 (+) Transcript_7820:1712-2311(+)